MNQILLPLRSNVGWFRGQETRKMLERIIKNYLIIYDKILIQDGRYECVLGESGSWDFFIPSKSINFDRTKIEFFKPSQKFSLLIGNEGSKPKHPLNIGNVIAAYQVDYYPILNDAGLLNVDYIQWWEYDLNQKSKDFAKKEASGDERDEKLIKILPHHHFQRKNILSSFFIDSLLAFFAKLPFLVDEKILQIVRWKNEQAKQLWGPALRDVFLNVWISLEHPDFGNQSWEEVCKIRESRIGKNYRRMIQRVTNDVEKALPDIQNEKDIFGIVQKNFHKEIVKELQAKQMKPRTTFLNILLNLFSFSHPLASVGIASFSSAKDIWTQVKDKNSWINLLGEKYGAR